MEFLKEILGEDLYKQFEAAVNAYNSKDENKDKQLKLADLSTGNYVSKAKYDALETELNNTKTELTNANNTITGLKNDSKDNADLQKKITDYETEKQNLESKHKEEISKLRKEGAIREALYAEKARHPELLLSKYDLSKIILDEKGENVVSGIKEQTEEHKKIYKDLFENSEGTGFKGVKSHNSQGEDKPTNAVSQGANFAKAMNTSAKTTESKFFN